MQLSPPGPRPRVLHVSQPVDGGVARVVTDLCGPSSPPGPRSPSPVRRAAHSPRRPRHWAAAYGPGTRPVRPGRGSRRRYGVCRQVVREVRPRPGARAQRQGGTRGAARRARPGADRVPAARLVVRGGRRRHGRARPQLGAARRALGLPRGVRQRGGATDRACGPGSPAAFTVIPNGVDPERFHPASADRTGRDSRLLGGIDPAAPLVVCVGRLCRQKGQDVLLRRLARGVRDGCRRRGSCWSATARTRQALRADRSLVGAVRRGRHRGRALVPGRRSGGPAVPLGGHGAGPAGGHGLRAAGRDHRRGRGAREPAAGPGAALSGAAGRTGRTGRGRSRAAARRRRCAGARRIRAAGTYTTTHDMRRARPRRSPRCTAS